MSKPKMHWRDAMSWKMDCKTIMKELIDKGMFTIFNRGEIPCFKYNMRTSFQTKYSAVRLTVDDMGTELFFFTDGIDVVGFAKDGNIMTFTATEILGV